MRGDGLVEDRDRGLDGLTCGDVGGDRLAGVVVLELEDHAFSSAGQHVFGRVELPARVRRRIDEPPPRRAGLLARFAARDAGLTEDPRQRRDRRHRIEPHRPHPVVDADRPVVQPGCLQHRPDPHRLGLDLVGQLRRTRHRPTRLRFEHRGRPLNLRTLTQRIERLARYTVLSTKRRHRTTRASSGQSAIARRTRGSIGSLVATTRASPPKCHHQDRPKCHRSPDTETSPMSCDMTHKSYRSTAARLVWQHAIEGALANWDRQDIDELVHWHCVCRRFVAEGAVTGRGPA